ncbi:MAG: toprim domain-containing protein [Cyanobacteria bacterium J06600_6]
MNLLIVESPGKIKKLRKILGSGWNIKASMGHFRELANDGEDNLGFDLCDQSIKMRFKPKDSKSSKFVSELKTSVKQASQQLIAGFQFRREKI